MRIRDLHERDLSNSTLSQRLNESDILRLSAPFPGVVEFSDRILEQIWLSIDRHGGQEKAGQIRQVGLEFLHRFLSPYQIMAITRDVNEWANQHIYGLLNRFLEDGLQVRDRFYLSTLSVVRFYVPWESFLNGEDIYQESRFFELKAHNPHLDSWFGFPKEAINLWVSLGRTQKDNGVLFYPSATKLPPPRDPDEPPKDWALGTPQIVFAPAREVLLFGGDIPHGTSVNRSEETRVSATFRFFLERPDKRTRNFFLYRHGGKRYESLLGRRVSELVVAFRKRRFSFLYWSRIRFNRLKSRALGVWRKRVSGRFLHRHPHQSQTVQTVSPVVANRGIEAISDSECRVKTKSGWVTFQRYCPHRGADLSHGTFDGEHIRCAWHNVGFSLRDGQSECSGMRRLRVTKIEVR